MLDSQTLMQLQADHVAIRFKVALIKFSLATKYNPDQPRLPAGGPGGGQWVGAVGGSVSGPRSRPSRDSAGRVRTAQVMMGSLVAQLGSGRDIRCVYRFGFGDVVVQGSILGTCAKRELSSAVVHGQLLNDNRKR